MNWDKNAYRLTPHDPKLVSEILAKTGVIIPVPINPEPIDRHPIQIPNLRNVILQIRTKPPGIPDDYKVLTYLNSQGFWEMLCVHISDIESACRTFKISNALIRQKFEIPGDLEEALARRAPLQAIMPDIVYNVRVNRGLLKKAIRQTAANFYQNNPHCTLKLDGNIAYLYKTQQLGGTHDMSDENLIIARYAKMLMEEAYDRETINWDELPPEYKTMYDIYKAEHRRKFMETSVMQKDIQRREKAGTVSKNPQVEELITKIEQPNICREPENQNRKTFDFIELRICVKTEQAMPNRNEIIQKHIHEIVRLGLNKIASAHRFKQYGVPAKFLKATRYVITNQNEMVLTYELKVKE